MLTGLLFLGAACVSSAGTPNQLENLRAFAKLYGYVRYFHPSDEASDIDWERFAVHGARQVKGAATKEDLKEALRSLFGPIAPTVQITATGERRPDLSDVLTPDDTTNLKLVCWQHLGVGLEGPPGRYRSVRLNRRTQIPKGPAFGTIVQSVDAAPYRGKSVKLRAGVKAEVSGVGNQAQLWLRVDRPKGQPGFFDNMDDRPVTERKWGTHEIVGTVAEDAEHIALGGFLAGSGKAWFDGFELFVRGGEQDAWSPVPLENAGFETIAKGEGPEGWFAPSSGYRLEAAEDAPEGKQSVVIRSPDEGGVVQPLFAEHPAAGEVVDRALGRGLSARIPLALWSRDGHTLRPTAATAVGSLETDLAAIPLEKLTAADEALRCANVIIAWNVFQHFYPYFDVVGTDWDAVLTRALRRALADRTPEDFFLTLRWMAAQLKDGHARVQHPLLRESGGLPILVDRIGGRVAIVAVAEGAEAACFEIGDVVISIDGVSAQRELSTSMEYISGTPQWKECVALRDFGRGKRGTRAHLVVDRAGRTIACDAARGFDGVLQEKRPQPIEKLRDDTYYVDLSRVEMGAINREVPSLAKAAGVVFDLRGYPNGTDEVLRHLTNTPLQSARWQTQRRIYPDQMKALPPDTSGRWLLPPKGPRFAGTIVFLSDARAISYSESVLGIVEHYRLGEIVGRPTAGANGNVNSIVLPDGYVVRWTGMRVLKNDGSRHHLVGIRPTVPVERTLAGLRAGRDEDLERALELIHSRTPSGR